MSEFMQLASLVVAVLNVMIIPAIGLVFRYVWLLEHRLGRIERRIVIHHPEDEPLFDRRAS